MTSSEVVEADRAGALVLADGTPLEADLVVGCDGAGSAVRQSLDLEQTRSRYQDGVVRVLIPRPKSFAGEEWNKMIDFWTLEPNVMRILYTPCANETIYLGMMAETDNPAASRTPIDPEVWGERFPHLAPLVELAALAEGGRHDSYQTNRVSPWSSGNVALIGDAAHAMCPAVAQGAGLGIVNGVSLARYLDEAADVGDALRAWEANERPLTDRTQERTADMAEYRKFAQGNGWTPTILEAANHIPVGTPRELEERWPIPFANRAPV